MYPTPIDHWLGRLALLIPKLLWSWWRPAGVCRRLLEQGKSSTEGAMTASAIGRVTKVVG